MKESLISVLSCLCGIIAENNAMATDGGTGSGNFGHEGRPGEIGGSLPSAKSMNSKVDKALKTKSKEQVKTLVRNLVAKLPISSKFTYTTHYGEKRVIEKVGDDSYSIPQGSGEPVVVSLDKLVNKGLFPESGEHIPEFHQLTAAEVRARKEKTGELKPTNSERSGSSKTLMEKQIEQRINDADKLGDYEKAQFIKTHSTVMTNEDLKKFSVAEKNDDFDAIREIYINTLKNYQEKISKTAAPRELRKNDIVNKVSEMPIQEKEHFVQDAYNRDINPKGNQYNRYQPVSDALDLHKQLPQVMSSDEFESYVKENNSTVFYRSVDGTGKISGEQILSDICFDDTNLYVGNGLYGQGLYFTAGIEESLAYGSSTVRVAIRSDAKIYDYYQQWDNDKTNVYKSGNYATADDASIYAATHGYDAILIKDGNRGNDFMCILNRAALIVDNPLESKFTQSDYNEKIKLTTPSTDEPT